MKKSTLTGLLLPSLLISSISLSQPTSSGMCYAQSKPAKNEAKQEPVPAVPQTVRAPLAFGLEDGTPIKLRITRTISSADAKVDDKVDFEVLEETKIGEVIVIPRGGIAWGTVTEAQEKRRMGRAGKLNVNIDSVRLVTGEKVALRAIKEVKGGGNTGKMTGAIVATSIVFFPAAPFFLFMHGKDITIPKGTEITAYVSGDAPLDPAKFAPKVANAEPSSEAVTSASATEPSMIVIKSTPDGADITVDGKFVGSTPSTLRLAIGDHTISIKKSGFTIWTRAMTVSAAGSVSIEATLEKVP
jgi:PEGA domain